MKKVYTFLGTYVLLFIALLSGDVHAQSACCPDFFLSDAIEVCPAQGACVSDGTDPIGQVSHIKAACKGTDHTYTVYPNDPTYTYTWSVSGGTPTSFTGNPINILWGTGVQGSITVTVNSSAAGLSCNDTITENICLIDAPEANFSLSSDTVCTNTAINFTNLSLGGSTFFWEFGDGNSSSLPLPPPHAYASPGTYTVTLTVQDMGSGQWVTSSTGNSETIVPCGCIDTYTKTVVVLPGDGPVIETDCCYGTVCPGDTSYFCTPMLCGTYDWIISGGTIISGSGTSCIAVQWDNSYSVPTSVGLVSCPGAGCVDTTFIEVPVLYPDLPISGPSVVCVGTSGTYSLPVLPGTYYNWSVSGGFHSFNLANRNVPLVNIAFSTVGTHYVRCEYNNPLSGCSGIDSVQVEVLPVFSIYGQDVLCEDDIVSFSASGAANWTISPAGPVIQSGNGTATVNILWTSGTYTLTAAPVNPSLFCNTLASKEILFVP